MNWQGMTAFRQYPHPRRQRRRPHPASGVFLPAMPSVFQSGANDGFHESVGDLLSLSITPNYLEKIGFVSKEEADSAKENSIAFLMKQALDGVVPTPWTLMLDKWRMAVFNGDLAEDEMNEMK